MHVLDVERLWESLRECSYDGNPKLVIEILSEGVPPNQVDSMYKGMELQDMLRLANALVAFIRQKKKEAKGRGVKNIYGR